MDKLNIQVGGFSGKATLTIKEHIVDILMLVAGTQDPININPEKHAANTKYWESITANLWSELKKLKPQFIDLNLSKEYFSWNGNNNEKERNEAAERLLDLITRLYLKSKEGKTLKFEGKEVHLHLIGHSHGGNVINQFTELITNGDMLAKSKYSIEELPEKWSIKSITYLSTPFFTKQHQLNHTKLHEDCKIINVHNDYDITQRFIADFSIKNLEELIKGFNKFEFHKAKEKINLISSSGVFNPITDGIIDDSTEGPLIWERMSLLLENLSIILVLIIEMVSKADLKGLAAEKKEINKILNDLNNWIPSAREGLKTTLDRYNSRKSDYKENANGVLEEKNWFEKRGGEIMNSQDVFEASDLMADLNMVVPLKIINKILFIEKEGLENSYLLRLLESIFATNAGVTESIDNTSWDPTKQLNGKFKPVDIPITKEDNFHSTEELKKKFEDFVAGAEQNIADNNLKEFLMRLVSQEISSDKIDAMSWKLSMADLAFSGEADTQFKKLRKKYIPRYSALIAQFDAHLIPEVKSEDSEKVVDAFTSSARISFEQKLKKINNLTKEQWLKDIEVKKEKEKNNPSPPILPKVGSLAHFATISHGLSHTKFWKDVEKGLRDSFSSGVNKGYKKKSKS